MIFGPRLRTIFDNIKPDVKSSLRYKNVKYEIENAKNYNRQFQQNDNVYVRTNLEKQWSPAKVIDRTNKYSYIVTNIVLINIRIKLLPTMVSREDDMLITFGSATTIYYLLVNRL
ncbi:hypothetical protein QE152_g3690 [Popillia japonica]|uniref:Uncharacterized protein n=1 Tax=Popillia japonica TaxID=7064 RepID=A0AAW1N559_POPJA